MQKSMITLILCFFITACVQNQDTLHYKSGSTVALTSSQYNQYNSSSSYPSGFLSLQTNYGDLSESNIKVIGNWRSYISEYYGQRMAMLETLTSSNATFSMGVTASAGKILCFYGIITKNLFNWPSGATVNSPALLIIGNRSYPIETENKVGGPLLSCRLSVPTNFNELASNSQYFTVNIQGIQIAKINLDGFKKAFSYTTDVARQIERGK